MKRALLFAILLLPASFAIAQAQPTAKSHTPASIRKADSAAAVRRDKPFPDVPKDHWAYQSVETLRRAGIVHGYPTQSPASK